MNTDEYEFATVLRATNLINVLFNLGFKTEYNLDTREANELKKLCCFGMREDYFVIGDYIKDHILGKIFYNHKTSQNGFHLITDYLTCKKLKSKTTSKPRMYLNSVILSNGRDIYKQEIDIRAFLFNYSDTDNDPTGKISLADAIIKLEDYLAKNAITKVKP